MGPDSEKKALRWGAAVAVALFAAVVGLAVASQWYKAVVQRDVYRRQGVEMSAWEVFWGARPVERYIKP